MGSGPVYSTAQPADQSENVKQVLTRPDDAESRTAPFPQNAHSEDKGRTIPGERTNLRMVQWEIKGESGPFQLKILLITFP